MTLKAQSKAASAARAAFFIALLAVGEASWAALLSDDEARRAIIDLRGRVEALTTRISNLERQLQTSSQSQLEMLNENERLRSDVSRLRGELEEANRAVTTGKKQQREILGEIDQRLKQIEPVSIEVDGVQHRVSPTEASQFDKLRELLRAGDFKSAVSAATNFEAAYPASSLAANALFIRGTASYALKDYKPSIAARLDFLKKYPDHPARPQAMLNLASSQAETGNPNTARATLEGLIKAYPNSPAAAEAKERLKIPPKAAPKPATPAPAAPAPKPAAPPPKPANPSK